MNDCGIGTGLVFMLIIGICIIHGLITGQVYWDRQEKQFKVKNSPAADTAEHQKNYTTLIIPNNEGKRKLEKSRKGTDIC